MQHEVLAVFSLERIDDLLVLPGAERGDGQRLGFAAGEQRAAMAARQGADLSHDGTHRFGIAPVDALAGLDDIAAHDILFDILEDAARHFELVSAEIQRRESRFLGCADLFDARLLDGLRIGLAQRTFSDAAQLLSERGLLGRRLRQIPGILGAFLGQIDDRADHRLEFAMRKHHRAEHDFFRQFACFDLTISTASVVPATTMSSWEFSAWSGVVLRTNSPST